jgi:hypothetical protein
MGKIEKVGIQVGISAFVFKSSSQFRLWVQHLVMTKLAQKPEVFFPFSFQDIISCTFYSLTFEEVQREVDNIHFLEQLHMKDNVHIYSFIVSL